jgi:hypothetical protein
MREGTLDGISLRKPRHQRGDYLNFVALHYSISIQHVNYNKQRLSNQKKTMTICKATSLNQTVRHTHTDHHLNHTHFINQIFL